MMPNKTIDQAQRHISASVDYWYEAHQTGILGAVEQIRSDLQQKGCPPGLAGTFLIGTARKGLWSISSGKVKENLASHLTPHLKTKSWFGEGGGKLSTVNRKLAERATKATQWAALGATAGVFLLGEAVQFTVKALIEDHNRMLRELWKYERRRQFGQFNVKMKELMTAFNSTKKNLLQKMNAQPDLFFGPWLEAIKEGKQQEADQYLDAFDRVFTTMDGKSVKLTNKKVEESFVQLWRDYLAVADQKFRAECGPTRRVMGEKRIFTPEEALETVLRRRRSPLALPGKVGDNLMSGPLKVDLRLSRFGLKWFHAANEWGEGKRQELVIVASINGKRKSLRPLHLKVGQSADLGDKLVWDDVPIYGNKVILTVAVTESDDWTNNTDDASDDGVGVLKVEIPVQRSKQNSWFLYGEQWLAGTGGASGGAIGRNSVKALPHTKRQRGKLSKRERTCAPFWVEMVYSVHDS